jgi:superfamily II DNA or RNA helicase
MNNLKLIVSSYKSQLDGAHLLPPSFFEEFNMYIPETDYINQCSHIPHSVIEISDNGIYKINLIDKEGFYLSGLNKLIIAKLKSMGVEYTTILSPTLNTITRPLTYKPDSRLRPEQIDVINKCLDNGRGLVQAYTGFGKSLCLSKIAEGFLLNNSHPFLIVVTSKKLLHQLYDELFSWTGIKANRIGDGFLECSDKPGVTIGIINSLYNNLDKPEFCNYLNKVGGVIFDECHTYLNMQGTSVLAALQNTIFKIGLSATVWREDKARSSAILYQGLFGSVLVRYEPKHGIDNDRILNPNIVFIKHDYTTKGNRYYVAQYLSKNISPGLFSNMERSFIIEHEERNRLIARVAKKLIEINPGLTIIVVKSVRETKNKLPHSTLIQQAVLRELGEEPEIIHGQTKKIEDKFKEMAATKTSKIYIVSQKLIMTGVSINAITNFIIAGGGKSDIDLIQGIGRVVRKGSNIPYVIDFMDNQHYFSSHSIARYETAKANYANTIQLNEDEFNKL